MFGIQIRNQFANMMKTNLLCVIFILGDYISKIYSNTTTVQPGNNVGEFARICYFTDWAIYRDGKGKQGPEDIDPELCTHILYAFALLDESLDQIKPADADVDLDKGFYKQIVSMKEKGVKVILSMGGWNESTEKYSKMMNDPQHRTNVVKYISEYLKKYGFQGFDVDVEYPHAYQGVVGSGVPQDKENFVQFLRELRKKFDEDHQSGCYAERPTLSIAVTGNQTIVEAAYDVPALAEVCDWIGVMTYDLHVQGDGRTGLVAPFTQQPGDKEADLSTNVKAHMNIWMSKGAPAQKLAVGIPFYGRTFHLVNASENGINAPAKGPAEQGQFTKDTATLAFYEIMDNVLQKQWTAVHVNEVGSYAYKGEQWVGYDDKYDVAVKANYIKENCFFGGMIWSLDNECFQQDCPGGRYPLLSTLKGVLTGTINYQDVKNIT